MSPFPKTSALGRDDTLYNQFEKPLYICTQRYMFSLEIFGFCGLFGRKGHTQIFTDLTLADHIPLKQGLRRAVRIDYGDDVVSQTIFH